MPPPRSAHASRSVPVGHRIVQLAVIAHRARRPLLLIGPHGIGKSAVLAEAAERLGISCITVDLSLCEPSDLVGLPHRDGERTVFAPPAFLPRDGEGLLVFEELNRAERFVQGPVLQLLSARRLNDYVLPSGWSCVAAINPEDGSYDVRSLDPAMLSRFLVVPVRSDRREWLAWARRAGLHPAVIHVVDQHSESLDAVPPRSWTYASEVLKSARPEELQDRGLLHDLLAGFLPEGFAVILAEALVHTHDGNPTASELLSRCAKDPALQRRLEHLRDRGRTDALTAIAKDVLEHVGSPLLLAQLLAAQAFSLEDFEATVARLPGDQRTSCQEALADNPAALSCVEFDHCDLLARGYAGRGHDQQLRQWQREEPLRHRAALFVRSLCRHLQRDADLVHLRTTNGGRRTLGRVLSDLQPALHDRLLETLAQLSIEPILPQRRTS